MGQSIGGEFRRGRKLELVADPHRLTDAQRAALRNDAARLRFSRQLRHKMFGTAMFGEAAWDILLTLYIADGRMPRLGVSDLARSAESPLSTTVRWLCYLDDQGLASTITLDPSGDAGGVELTHKGRSLLDDYFLDLHRAESSWPADADPGDAG